MKKSIKFFIFTVLGIAVLTTCFTNETKATEVMTNNHYKIDLNEIVTEEELLESQNINAETKIMEYDSSTGETREVNMEELRQNLIRAYGLQNAQTAKTEAYNPGKNTILKSKKYASNPTIPDVSQFPFRTICYITLKDNHGGEGNASGFLVGKNLLLTAAHCVFDRNHKDELFTWQATVGRDGDYNYGSSRLVKNILFK